MPASLPTVLIEDWQNGGFGLYLHWPFCQSKCPYCDFNSHVAASIDQSRWQRAYLSEIARTGAQTPGRVLNSIYFGGGTPSLMSPDIVSAIISSAREQWKFANDTEITLEANPSSIEAGRFTGYRDAGVNRISMGVQAMNDPDLKRLGRLHTVAEARAAFDIARNTFDRVNFDLIYARQNQTLTDWKSELQEALSMGADHMSLYQLTIEQGTAFGDLYNKGKLRALPDDDTAADMFYQTQELCDQAGLPAYEVSNHAKPGEESRHNLIYWKYGDYAGIGPGAHGRLTISGSKHATQTLLSPEKWLSSVEARQTGELPREVLSKYDQSTEYLMMGMRLSDGINTARFRDLAGKPLSTAALEMLTSLNLVKEGAHTLKTTAKGRPVLNAVLRELMADL